MDVVKFVSVMGINWFRSVNKLCMAVVRIEPFIFI